MWRFQQIGTVLSRIVLLTNPRISHNRGIQTASTIFSFEKTSQRVATKPDALESTKTKYVPEHASVVIIGGGVIGCSTLYHLAKLGVHDAVLLEKDQITAGTTWHTAGMIWSLRPNDTEIQLLINSKKLMSETLEKETGVNTGWINNGGLFVTQTEERLNEYKRLHTLGKAYGIESHILTPEETKKVYPLMNVSDLCGSIYSPSDGTIDPTGYCTALTRGAAKHGAKLVQDCRVTGIQTFIDDFGTKKVKAVETEQGTIKCDAVVISSGVWSPYLGSMAGVTMPMIAMRHAYVLTERIEGIQNMPNMRDHDASVYCKLQGDALGVGGYEPNPVFIDKMKNDFAFSLYDLDWDVFGFCIDGAINRIPAIANSGVKSTVCGPESFTPDHHPLLGESPEVRGFYFACAFNSGGMMHSSFAEQLAHWIVHGRPELNMYHYDVRRLTSRLTSNKKWVKEKCQESYAKSYSIIYPHDEPLAGRNMRQDPLYQELLEAGCVYQERHGWERPGWFSQHGPAKPLPYDYYGYYGYESNKENPYYDKLKLDYTFGFPKNHDQIGKECLACRDSVAVFNMSYFGKYYLVGQDAQTAADWIFSNNMQKPPGSTVYTCMLNERGGIELDLTVSVIDSGTEAPHSPKFNGSGFYLAIGGGAAQHGYSYILDLIQDHHWDCQLLDMSEDMCLISVQGPKSRDVLQSLTDTDLSNEAFPFATNKVLTVAGHDMRALRMSYVGELGWELHVPSNVALDTYRAVMQAGRHYGAVNAGYRAMDSLSLEKGYRMWQHDARSDDNPLEALLGFTCKLSKDTPFLGREALLSAKKQGLHKKLAYFTLRSHEPLFGYEVIWRNETVVGYLRRGDYAHKLGCSMGCGYITNPNGGPVTLDYLKTGEYRIESMGVMHPATIHLKSPFDPDNKRIRGVYT